MDSTSGFREPGLHAERPIATFNGFFVLVVGLALIGGSVWKLIDVIATRPTLMGVLAAIALFVLGVLVLAGLYTLQPNEAAILQLFGAYRGTSRVPGLRATNPFYTRKKLSLRARNLMGDKLKVNDKRGNPIEIACGRRLAHRGHGQGGVRRRRLRDIRQGAERGRGPPPRLVVRLRRRRGPARQRGVRERADAARRRRRRRPRAGARTAGAARAGRRRGRGSAAHAPRLRARDRAGDAAPPAGRGDHRRARRRSCTARCRWCRWRSPSCRPRRSSNSTTSARRRWCRT